MKTWEVLRILGMQEIIFVNEDVKVNNEGEFVWFPVEDRKYIFTVVAEDCNIFDITFEYYNYESGPVVLYANTTVNVRVERSGNKPHIYTHKPVGEQMLDGMAIVSTNGVLQLKSVVDGDYFDDKFSCEAFSVSIWGEDIYYPNGSIHINAGVFKKLPRAMDKRPVYVVYGDSGLGKSSVTSRLNRNIYSVYETDSSEELPDCITADVIVLGNKYNHTLSDVKSKLFGDPKVITVRFTEE